MARIANPKLRCERYPTKGKTQPHGARFLLGKKVVFSGYAPDDDFNDKLCLLFNVGVKNGTSGFDHSKGRTDLRAAGH